MTIRNTRNRIAAQELLPDLLDAQSLAFPGAPYGADPAPNGPEEARYLPFRVRTLDGSTLELLTGCASFDTDHHGSWGAGSIGFDTQAGEAEDALYDAIEEALDDWAMSRDLV